MKNNYLFYKNHEDHQHHLGWVNGVPALSDDNRQLFADLEYEHDFIQWWFPTKEKSQFQPNVPTLSDADIQQFHQDDVAKGVLLERFLVMLAFYGLRLKKTDDTVAVEKADNFNERKNNWVDGSHNLLRMTRIMTCLNILGLREYAVAFHRAVSDILRVERPSVYLHTKAYWDKAVAGVPQVTQQAYPLSSSPVFGGQQQGVAAAAVASSSVEPSCCWGWFRKK